MEVIHLRSHIKDWDLFFQSEHKFNHKISQIPLFKSKCSINAGKFYSMTAILILSENCRIELVKSLPALVLNNGSSFISVFYGKLDPPVFQNWIEEELSLRPPSTLQFNAANYTEFDVFFRLNDSIIFLNRGDHADFEPIMRYVAQETKVWRSQIGLDMAVLHCHADNRKCAEITNESKAQVMNFRRNELVGTYRNSLDRQYFERFVMQTIATYGQNISSLRKRSLDIQRRGVVNIDETNFHIINEGWWFIEFFAPWCPHCKAFAPTWKEFANQATEIIQVGAIDCEKEENLRNKFAIRGFPTLKLFKNSELVSEYQGKRDVKSLNDFVRKFVKTTIENSVTAEYFNITSVDDDDAKFLYLSKDKALSSFLKFKAKQHQDFIFFTSEDDSLYEKLSLSKESSYLIVFKAGLMHYIVVSGLHSHSETELSMWIERNRYPLIMDLKQKSELVKLYKTHKYLVLLLRDPTFDLNERSIVRQVAKTCAFDESFQKKDQALFLTADGFKFQTYFRQNFRIKFQKLPAVVILSPGGLRVFKLAADGKEIGLIPERIESSLLDARYGILYGTCGGGAIGKLYDSFSRGIPGLVDLVVTTPITSCIFSWIVWRLVKWKFGDSKSVQRPELGKAD